MVVLSLTALFVYLFGAYAYGAATVLALRDAGPVWSRPRGPSTETQRPLEHAALGLFVLSTLWFVVQTLVEFGILMGGQRNDDWIDLAGFVLTFLFPPLIMATVYGETRCEPAWSPRRSSRHALTAMYVLSPGVGAYLTAAILGFVPRPPAFGSVIGFSISGLFILASAYSAVIMYRRERPNPTLSQRRLRTTMLSLFGVLTVLIVALTVLRGAPLAIDVLERLMKCAPIYFLIASVYFENRFEFYDLVVKRALMLLVSLAVVGGFLAAGLPWLDELPAGPARPWLFAVALVPLAMLMPWLHAAVTRWLDRIWFGREFTPVEAVKHVLAGMQPATDEASLVAATESRLSEIFDAPVVALLDGREPPADATIDAEVSSPSPVSHAPVRFVVLREPGARPLLSEDLALLRSLASVFGFMLENVRLQHKRQEQEQVAQQLRLQSSHSELKALRAQINPHFLFNALNAIASLIHTDPTRADAAVEQLAEVFRYTLRRSETDWAPLDQELAFARAYLDVEQARFGHRLTFTVEAAPDSADAQVPSMLLQTLVENAVKHGISQLRHPGRIDVLATTDAHTVTLEVRDSGPGPGTSDRPRRADGESFGLRSVRDRLRGHFGNSASLALVRDEAAGVTVARITLPRVEARA